METTVGKSIDSRKIPLVVCEHRFAQSACERSTGELALPKSLVTSTLTSKSDDVLQIVDLQIHPTNLALVNVCPQTLAHLFSLYRWLSTPRLDEALIEDGARDDKRHRHLPCRPE